MIVLASASSRRKQLLEEMGISFIIDPSDVNEEFPEKMKPEEIVMFLSQSKAEDVLKRHPQSVIIAADTIVVHQGRILGKPENKNHAFNMLKSLSGDWHEVYTGVSICTANKKKTFFSVAEVEFKDLSELEIKEYIETEEPMDKAGSYAIQGLGSKIVQGFKGDFFTIVGLPLKALKEELKHFSDEINPK